MPARINLGYCSICQRPVLFERKGPWLRDQYLCCRCGSIPRQRHLMHVLQRVCTDWRTLTIHECAPGGAISEKLARECPGGSFSHYLPHLTLGSYREDGIRSENLEAMTFLDSSFDVVITQDVFEHVFDVQAAFREIARVLKPGGLHVFTVPLYHGQITMTRAIRDESNEVIHLLPAVYHSDPTTADGCLVVTDWGEDLVEIVAAASGMATDIYPGPYRWLGIEGMFLEVFVSRKT